MSARRATGREHTGVRSARSRLLAPGERLAGRFEVVRFLARGGMGEVYEATDLELNERVAIKTIRPEIASDRSAIARLKRELQLARKVTQANVCRVFDFWTEPVRAEHRRRRISFVTMELLPGVTLDSWLESKGHFPQGEALPIARQLIEALAAAHDVGVVHRDFKCGNVLILEQPTQCDDGETRSDARSYRAVVTDFGLARERPDGESRRALLDPDARGPGFAGTPAYMAPEQFEAGAVGPWSDIYALGIVLFEMLTGFIPFVTTPSTGSEDSGETTDQRLGELARRRCSLDPPSPRLFVSSLDPRWEATILRCLERRPERRFPHVRDLLASLPEDGSARARILAVLPAHLPSHLLDRDAIGIAYAAAVRAACSPDEQLVVIRVEEATRAVRTLGVREGAVTSGQAKLLRARLGADLLIGAAWLESVGSWRIQIHDAATGALRFEKLHAGSVDEWRTAALTTAGSLRELLKLPAQPEEDSQRLERTLPASKESMSAFASGLDALAHDDLPEAIRSLGSASALAPACALVQSTYSEALARAGEHDRARAAALEAHGSAGLLPRTLQLTFEARLRALEGNWPRAIRLWRSLALLRPDDVEAGLRLVEVQLAAGRLDEVAATLSRLRALPIPLCDDPRIDELDAEYRSRERTQSESLTEPETR